MTLGSVFWEAYVQNVGAWEDLGDFLTLLWTADWISHTHPHKKGPVMENYSRHLTSFSMVIYQAEHDLWCPINVGWENFAQLQIFQVK